MNSLLRLTDARDDVELLVDLLVHGRGNDADPREGVRHGVDAHLCHEEGEQEDPFLWHVVVLGHIHRHSRCYQ